jgi:hypothetical protein
LSVAPLFQLPAASIGIEPLDLTFDGGDLAVDGEGRDAALDLSDLALHIEGADVGFDPGDLPSVLSASISRSTAATFDSALAS